MELSWIILFSMSCFVLVFSLAGNSLVIYIISKKQRTSTDYLLLNMVISDLIFGVFNVIFQILYVIFISDELSYKVPPFCILLNTGNVLWMTSDVSSYTMLTLSVERYFAVCRPHSFKKWFSKRNVKFMIVMCWLFAIATTVPLFAKCSDLNHKKWKLHSLWKLIQSMSTLTVLAVLSLKIYVSLWCKHTALQPTGLREIEERKKKKKVTLCVLAVIVTYIVFYIPNLTLYVSSALKQELETTWLIQFTQLCIAINAALDPYLFSFQNPRMREVVKKLLLCKTNEQVLPEQAQQQQPQPV